MYIKEQGTDNFIDEPLKSRGARKEHSISDVLAFDNLNVVLFNVSHSGPTRYDKTETSYHSTKK